MRSKPIKSVSRRFWESEVQASIIKREELFLMDILGISPQALFSQLLLGLINGGFYAMLSLGLAIIFGLLNVINFVHGAQYMMGAFGAYMLLNYAGIPYWYALVLSPIAVGALGVLIEHVFLRRLYHLDHLYGLLLTFGLTLIIEGFFRKIYGSSGLAYPNPLPGAINLGFMVLPKYRVFILFSSIVICLSTWLIIEKTKLGSRLRAAIERPDIVQALGVNVPLMIKLTYGAGVALAALAGVLAVPAFQASPIMGTNLIMLVFAIVVIGGMGSLLGAIITGFSLGLLEAVGKILYPEISSTIIFVIMVIVLMIKPAGIFGSAR